MIGIDDVDRTTATSMFRRFAILTIDDAIAELAVAIRRARLAGRKSGLSGIDKKYLPDCIIHATGLRYAAEILTRNTSDFPDLRSYSPLIRQYPTQARQPYPD